MATLTKFIGVRLDDPHLKTLDEIIAQLASRNPDWPQPTRSDAIRHAIASSGSVISQTVTGISAPPPRNSTT